MGWHVTHNSGYESVSGPTKNLQNGLLTGGAQETLIPSFDPIIIAKFSQWGFLRLRITVGHIGDGKIV